MFELIPHGTKIPFMKARTLFVIFSVVMTVMAMSVIQKKGFNFGVDFAGGIQLVVTTPESLNVGSDTLREAFESMGVKGVTVQEFGGDKTASKGNHDFNVHFAADFLDEAQVKAHFENLLKPLAKTANPVKGLRFVGLEKAYLTLNEAISRETLATALKAPVGGLLELIDVQAFGRESANEYQLNFKSIQGILQTALSSKFKGSSGQTAEIQKIDFVGAKVGQDLKLSGILSFLITVILVFLYIFLRFDFVYAPGVVLSLVHDVLVTAGLISYLGIEFDLTMVAALMTLAGYSINDTIIIYDRIREVAHTMRGKAFVEIIDLSINQTLSRTIITSGTTFVASLALYIWGGPVLHGFSFAMLVGVAVGTYSSVFIAAPTILLTNWLKSKERPVRRAA